MDKFLIKRPRSPCSVNKNSTCKLNSGASADSIPSVSNTNTEKRANIEFNSADIISDPGLRIPIDGYNVNIRDQVRRAYIAKGPFQPLDYNFPKKPFNKEMRSFQTNWFKEFDWLEYSIAKDEAYCLWCYLFKPDRAKNTGKNAFTTTGFNNWRKALVVFRAHVGGVGSSHNEATRHCQSFKNQRQSISHIFSAHGYEIEADYRKRLTAVLNVIRLLLRQGFAFRGHDESSDSLNKGNFLEILEWHCDHNAEVKKASRSNAPVRLAQFYMQKLKKHHVLSKTCPTCTILSRRFLFSRFRVVAKSVGQFYL